jgi:hypothetical protein
LNYSTFINPAASFLQYEWLYRQHAGGNNSSPFGMPGAMWMQGALQPVYDCWPWSAPTGNSAFERKNETKLHATGDCIRPEPTKQSED